MCSAILPDHVEKLFFRSLPTPAGETFHVRVKVTASTLYQVVFKAWGKMFFTVYLSLDGLSQGLWNTAEARVYHGSNLQEIKQMESDAMSLNSRLETCTVVILFCCFNQIEVNHTVLLDLHL